MKVLITGAAGQVGRALAASAPAQIQLTALSRGELDIADAAAVQQVVTALRPQLIINAAAYTGVDAAEREPAAAHAANALGPQHLAAAAATLADCRLLQVSTDYVFDGSARRPYRPEDPVQPLGVYGRSKRAGETAVLGQLGSRAAVVRTAWVYAAVGRNFLLTMLERMRQGVPLRVVADQIGTPTAAASVARALWQLAALPAVHGILHWTDAGHTSWYGFASAIGEEALAAGLLAQPPQVSPIETSDYPTAARRPAYSVLDTTATAALLRLTPPLWRASLRATIGQLAASVPRSPPAR